MLPELVKKSKNDSSQQKFNNLNDCIIKIDYFDKKGTKDRENIIPLTCILNPVVELHK